MASIGAHSVLKLSGGINPGSGEQLEEITRPGVDGVAFRRIGRRGIPFELQTVVDVSSAAAAQALVASYKALQGTLVNIVDDTGQIWNGYIVLRVRHLSTRRIQTAVGGLSGIPAYLVSASWMLQATETS